MGWLTRNPTEGMRRAQKPLAWFAGFWLLSRRARGGSVGIRVEMLQHIHC